MPDSNGNRAVSLTYNSTNRRDAEVAKSAQRTLKLRHYTFRVVGRPV